MTLPQFNQLPDASATQSPLNECDGTLWVISPKASTNLCTNPSFETDTNNWSTSSSIVRVNTPWAGAWSLSWSATSSVYLDYGTTTPFLIQSRGYYAISFYGYVAKKLGGNLSYTITIEVFTTMGVSVAKMTQPITNNWSRIILNFYVPSAIGTKNCTFRITTNTSNIVVIDAVQIEQTVDVSGSNIPPNQGATTYFDGSTASTVSNSQLTSPQYAWQGKAHASTSARSVGAANGGDLIDLQNKLGFTIVGVIGADNPAHNNQIVSFNGTDGASLQDILIPPRQITFIGRISSTDKTSLARKVSTFLQYFGRDTTAIRQPKYFVFQFKDGRESIGQPMYFSGVIMNTANVPLSNDLAYTVSITVNMIDPFFYGHTVGFRVSFSNLNNSYGSLSYIPDFTTTSDLTLSTYVQQLFTSNGNTRAIAVANDGTIFVGGDFTVFNGLANSAYIVKYVPSTNALSVLSSGINALNGTVSALAITPDGDDLWIGGAFTTANGLAANRIARYTIATGTWSTYGAGAGGGVNAAVLAIAINPKRLASSGGGYPYEVYIGGSFTSANAVPMYRIARTSQTANTWLAFGTGSGMNGDVLALAYNNNLNRLYIGGSFTTSQAGAANAFTGICYINMATPGTTVAFYTGVNVAAGGYVYSIYTSDVDNALYIGGSFTATFAGATLLRAASFNGVVWNQLDVGLSDGIVYDIQPYNNGFVLSGTFTSGGGYTGYFNGLAWYNGQSFAPMAASGLGNGYYSTIVTPGNILYLGAINDRFGSGSVVPVTNEGTALSPIVWQIYHNDPAVYDFVLNQIANLTQQTAVSFKQLPITYKEFVQINTATGAITSDIMGNQLRYILGSGITAQRVMPGQNYLMYWYVTTATTASIDIAAFWRKAYYTLFDGVDAT
jgi:hypothetical protein